MRKFLDSSKLPAGAKEALITAKIDLVRKYPFVGNLVMSTEMGFVDDPAIKTAAATTIPCNRVFINADFFVNQMNKRELRPFIIAHEILHIFLEHIGRARDHQYHRGLWNVATDFCINGSLKQMIDGADRSVMEMPDFVLHDTTHYGKSADQIYHELLQEHDNDAEAAANAYGAGNIGDEDYEGQRPVDKVSDESVSEETKVSNRQMVAGSLNEAGSSSMGEGYGDLIRQFEELVESKLPWQSLLQEFVTQTTKIRPTYNRVSRRSTARVMFPTLTGDSINLVYGVDTSGSMSTEDLSECMTELRSIVESYESWYVTMLSCDTRAHVLGEYDSENGDEWETMSKELIGGGGTDMAPMVEYAHEMEDEPNVCVILTDGFVPEESIIDAVQDIPTIIVVTSSGNSELNLEGENLRTIHMTDT